MKQIDLTGVVLNPAARTLDFSALAIDPRSVLAVLHEPTNRFIFAAGRSGLGYASIAGAVMTLATDTSDLAAGPLTGFRDDGADVATDARLEACRALIATGNATLSNIYAGIGTPADAPPGSDAGAGSLIAKLTRLLGTQTGIATILAAVRDRLPATLVGGRLTVDGSGVTQPISAAALPLPAGAATATAQGTGNASLASIDGKVPALVSGRTPVDGSGVTQPVSAAALPLPAGAATAALQTTATTALGAPADAAYAGAGSSTIIAALKGLYNALLAATPAGSNVIGSTTLRSAGTNRSAAVTTTASTPMAANASRQGWKVKNDGAATVWVNFLGTATAAAGSGNMAIPAGGYLASEPGFVETGAMSAIAGAGSVALTIVEF